MCRVGNSAPSSDREASGTAVGDITTEDPRESIALTAHGKTKEKELHTNTVLNKAFLADV